MADIRKRKVFRGKNYAREISTILSSEFSFWLLFEDQILTKYLVGGNTSHILHIKEPPIGRQNDYIANPCPYLGLPGEKLWSAIYL